MTDGLKQRQTINRPLLSTIAAIRMERGKQQGNYIDLTLSDGETEAECLISTQIVAVAEPEMADRFLSPPRSKGEASFFIPAISFL
jgi:hypothetical protein